MQNLVLFSLLAVLFTLGGCEKTKEVIKQYVPLFTCKVNGTSWTGLGTWVKNTTLTTQTVITGVGSSGSAGTIALTFNGGATGTYKFESLMTGNVASYSEGTKVYKATGGTLNITKYDDTEKRISGNFDLTIKTDSTELKITEGSFTDLPTK